MTASSQDKTVSETIRRDSVASQHDSSFVDRDGARRLPLGKRILTIIWDSLDKPKEERALLAKMDWWILSYCCIAYFVKYLDQTNISNAYISGMKEDLTLSGNDLNLLTTYWTIGYILGQLPSQIIMTKIPLQSGYRLWS